MKKILMLLSSWGTEFSKSLIDGINERLADCGDDYELHILHAYDDWIFHPYYLKDNEIYGLVNPADYDGLILSFNSVKSLKVIDDVANEFIKNDKPVVCVDKSYEGASFCGLDNYCAMYRMVEHMINIHDCRTLNYVGGYPDHEENMERFRAYCDCLKEHGITVDPKRVVHKSFTIEDGADAYNEFKAIDYHMPDVVICANDKMAIGYTDAAMADGILVPDYLKVTGFDETMIAKSHSPSITTMSRNWTQLGIDSMDTLLSQIENGTKIEYRHNDGYIYFNESCGCEAIRNIRDHYNRLVAANNGQLTLGSLQMNIRQLLLNSHSFKDFQQGLKAGRDELGFADIAVCVNTFDVKGGLVDNYEGYTDELDMFTETDLVRINKHEQLYPAQWKEKGEKVFVFSPLHYSGTSVGYTVMPYRTDFISRVKLRTLTEGISIAIGNIIMRRQVTALKKNQ